MHSFGLWGLGIQKLTTFNQSLLGKWLWRFGLEENKLWRQVVTVKYGEEWGGWLSKPVLGTHGCEFWRSIRMKGGHFLRSIWFVVGSGS